MSSWSIWLMASNIGLVMPSFLCNLLHRPFGWEVQWTCLTALSSVAHHAWPSNAWLEVLDVSIAFLLFPMLQTFAAQPWVSFREKDLWTKVRIGALWLVLVAAFGLGHIWSLRSWESAMVEIAAFLLVIGLTAAASKLPRRSVAPEPDAFAMGLFRAAMGTAFLCYILSQVRSSTEDEGWFAFWHGWWHICVGLAVSIWFVTHDPVPSAREEGSYV